MALLVCILLSLTPSNRKYCDRVKFSKSRFHRKYYIFRCLLSPKKWFLENGLYVRVCDSMAQNRKITESSNLVGIDSTLSAVGYHRIRQ
uniref:Secreted protein n=1 Tax=Panstrongylus lignarius TaxID=156445 RepID=A0A224Y3K5_9HEMI